MEERNFGYLGFSFQQSLIKAIIEDKKYGETIIDVLESKFFDNNSFRFIMENTKELYKTYNKIPDYNTLAQKIMAEGGNKDSSKVHVDTLEAIKNNESQTEYIRDTALNFCKQQNLKRELKSVQSIIESGEFEAYNKIEEIIQKALQVGLSNDEATDVFHDIDGALEKDFRHPLPTGIVGVDNLLKGGLGIGELGIVLAPTGTGKTTLLTKFANTAYNLGYNVVQIFFEDNPGNIKRKHYTIWTEIRPDDQPEFKEEVKAKVEEAQAKSKGSLKLLKLASDSVTVSEIKNKIRKMNSEGNKKIDLLVLDYVDCISSDKSTNGEEWKGEGSVMRSLESMTTEFEMAIWTATQGNRDSISSEVVTGDQMGGSIKKAQIAHVILSIGKTLEQKEHNLATLSLIKSRIGQDGVVFQNCKFNNEFLVIDTESQSTLLGHEEQEAQKRANRAADIYKKNQEKKTAAALR
jgi:replicative DNA helicase